ncbi:MAG: rod shape-determining protein RodA [Bacteroidales bacterium]|nr:rod shape-determining protein RodA [Bacteroidales bacterium]
MIEENAHQRGLKQAIDWRLVGVYFLLVLIGWVNIYASLHSTDTASIFDWSSRAGKQFVWILTGFGLAGIILFLVPPRLWEGVSIPFYIMVLGLLVLVIFVSSDVKGSHSWFNLGPVRFQPAEISKISTSLLLAYVMSQQNFKITKWKDFLTAILVIGIPMLVIVAESETGSALVYVGFIFVLYREGLSGWWLGAIGLVIALFISTLTLGAYWSVLLLVGILAISNAFMGPAKAFWRRSLLGAGFIGLMAPLPWAWSRLSDAVARKMDWIAQVNWVPQAGESQDYFWHFLPSVEPLYILLALCFILLPFLAVYAYRKRDEFLLLSILAFVAGVILIFSTDYIFQHVLQPHQRGRIEVLLGMKEDLSGLGYNVNQSKIAIGSGGLFGKGFLQGTQTTFGFVPEQSTDFIFCTVGEEWGFAGCLLVILLYAFLITRLILDAERCRSHFARIYGYCCASCIFMHLFINVGMTIGLMPVIGIPLPLLSYGGSSLWAFTVMIFLFLALYRDEKKYF